MTIHVILEFDTQEQAVEALGGIEARHIVEWFDDQELQGTPPDGAAKALEVDALHRHTA